MTFGVSLDALSGIVTAVREGWGDYGYRVDKVEGTLDGSAFAEVRHLDGSRFIVCADLYGVVVGTGFDDVGAAQAALLGHRRAHA